MPALGMCVVSGSIAIWNAFYIAHHVAVDSDPGVYEVTGRWLADHRSLIVNGATPWSGTGLKVSPGSPGAYLKAGDRLEFQFVHLLPVLLADAYRIAGAGAMFRTTAIIGAVGLGAVYVVGCRIVRRPWLVLAAVTALGVSLPELSVTRDTYTEPVSQLLIWSGIWLLMRAYEERRTSVAVLAGAAIGGTLMVHIDSVIYLVPLPLLAAVAWVNASSPADRRRIGRLVVAVLVGLVPPSVLGTVDVQRRSGTYYDDLHHQIHSLYGALGLATLIGLATVIVWPRLAGSRRWLVDRRKQLGAVAGWVVAGGLVLAWSLRPAGPKITNGKINGPILALQRAENVPIQPTRTYAEQSMRWIEWYIGPVALVLAIAGICLLMIRMFTKRSPRGVVLLSMTGPLTAIYLWNPSITPDQIWAMRRYVPVSLPLLLLAAAFAIDALASWLGSRPQDRAWQRRAVVAGSVGMLAFSLGATLPVGRFQPQANYLPALETTCKSVGPNAAVLFVRNDIDAALLPDAMRSWCDIPDGQLLAPISEPQLQTAVTALRAEGKTLWVLGSSPNAISTVVPGLTPRLIATGISPREIQPTLTKPASTYYTATLVIYGAPVSP